MQKRLSTHERLKQLDEERRKLLDGAKKEAMEKVRHALNELNALGFNYQVAERGRGQSAGKARSSGSGRTGTRTVKDAPCPICGFKTSPPHDRRAHRIQRTKKPFTDAELGARHLKKAA